MIRVCLEMKTITFKALQLCRQVFQVFEALTLEMIKLFNRSTKDTEHRGTKFCAAVIQVFEALTLSMFKVLNRSTRGGEHRDSKFSNLPTFVLWKIKDRLDFPDSLRIASVCKGWREASLSYTKDVKFRGESPPWIMYRRVHGSGVSDFINISTGEEYSIFNQDFCQAESKTLYSKQGWFLLHTKSSGIVCNVDEESMGNVFLLNPFTNKKIELPSPSIFLYGRCCGAFTIKDGKPDLVLVVASSPYRKFLYEGRSGCGCGCTRLWTIHVGKKNLWTEHTYENPEWMVVGHVEIFGEKVYIVCGSETFLIFSLSSCEWIPVKQSWGDSFGPPYILETDEGKVWKFHSHDTTFHQLNDWGWEQLKVTEHKHLCCFLKGLSKGYLVSRFAPKDVDAFSDYMKKSYFFDRKIIQYDNDDNTINSVVMYIIDKDSRAEWVDMP